MTSQVNHRFDQLLHAMTTKKPLDVGKTAKATQASSAGSSEGSGGTQTPKGTSATTSLKR